MSGVTAARSARIACSACRDTPRSRAISTRGRPSAGRISSRNSSPGCIAGSPVAVLGLIVNGNPPNRRRWRQRHPKPKVIRQFPVTRMRPAGFALQRVPVEAGQVQLLGPGCGVERAAACVPLSRRSARSTCSGRRLEIPPERPVAETAYHQRKRDTASGKRQVPLYGDTSPGFDNRTPVHNLSRGSKERRSTVKLRFELHMSRPGKIHGV